MRGNGIEAISYGLPVVATDVGDNSVYCGDQRGSIVPVKNNIKMSEKIVFEIENDNEHKKKSRIDYIKNNFSRFNMISNYNNYFDNCVN